MTEERTTILLSGTRRDLGEHFLAAKVALDELPGFRAIVMEGSPSEDLPMDRWSRREASIHDLLVGLIGWCYGQIPAGSEISVTEQEYDTAGAAGVDRLMFLIPETLRPETTDELPESMEKLERFRTRLGGDVVYNNIESPEDFAGRARVAVLSWAARTLHGSTCRAEWRYQPWIRPDHDFGHQTPLVGNEMTLKALRDFQHGSPRLLLFVAPWGRGKSRLLLEWGRQSGKGVRFVRERAPLTKSSLAVSIVDPEVVVLDDAHLFNGEQVASLLSLLARSSQLKVVAATRPTFLPGLREAARQAGLAAQDITIHEVPPLSKPEHRHLVATILTEDERAAYLIAKRTQGNVLAAVVTARQFRRGSLTLAEVEQSPSFHQAVWTAYQAAVESLVTAHSDLPIRETVKALAIAAPLNLEESDGLGDVAELASCRVDQLLRAVAALDHSGILVKHGTRVRIALDALADQEILHACADRGRSLGYAERAMEVLWARFRGNILRNLGAAEWDAAHSGQPVDLLGLALRKARQDYEAVDSWRRERIFSELEPLTYQHPERLLPFVHGITAFHGSQPAAGDLTERNRDALAALLRGTLEAAELLPRGCDAIWELVESQDEQTPRNDRTAEGILQHAGGYAKHRDLSVNQAFLAWARSRRVGARRIPGHRLARYLAAGLAREFEDNWADDRTFYITSYPVSPRRTAALREGTLELLEDIALTDSPRAAVQAVAVTRETLAYFSPREGGSVAKGIETGWRKEQSKSLDRLARIRSARTEPAVQIAVTQAVSWLVDHGIDGKAKAKATRVFTDAMTALDGTVALAIVQPWVLRPASDDDAQHEAVIRSCIERRKFASRSVQEILAELRTARDALADAGIQANVGGLLFELARSEPNIGEALLRLLAHEDHPLAESAASAAFGLFQLKPDRAVLVVDELVPSANPRALGSLAWFLSGEAVIAASPPERILTHLHFMLSHPDAAVQRAAFTAAGRGRSLPRKPLLDLLLQFGPTRESVLADDWSKAIAWGKHPATASEEDRGRILASVEDQRDLRYYACQVLADTAQHSPGLVVDFLCTRVERLRDAPTGSRPIPDEPNVDRVFEPLPTAERLRGIARLHVLLADSDPWLASEAGRLFRLLWPHDPTSLRETRMAWARGGSAEDLSRLLATLQPNEPKIVFDEELVGIVLENSRAVSPEFYEEAESTLLRLPFEGTRHGAAGEPFPQDQAVKDRAEDLVTRLPAATPLGTFYRKLRDSAEEQIRWFMTRQDH